MNTAADDTREEAKEHISTACELLLDMTKKWGWKDYLPEYQDKVIHSAHTLMKMSREL